MIVPARYIKLAKIDYEEEILSSLGSPFAFAGGLRVNPPTLGVFALLELVDSQFVSKPDASGAVDVARTVYVVARPKEALRDLRDFLAKKPDTDNALDRAAGAFCDANLMESDVDDLPRFREFLMEAFSAFKMLPRGAGSESEFIFDAEVIGYNAEKYGMAGIWEIPLCLLGFMAVARARLDRVKGVSRPRDEADFRRICAEANAAVERGELLPWQWDDPLCNELSQRQVEVNPRLSELRKTLCGKQLSHGGKYTAWLAENREELEKFARGESCQN